MKRPCLFSLCSLKHHNNKNKSILAAANSGSQITWLDVHIYPQDPEYGLFFPPCWLQGDLVQTGNVSSENQSQDMSNTTKCRVLSRTESSLLLALKKRNAPNGSLVRKRRMSDGWGFSQLSSDIQVILDLYFFPMKMLFYWKVASYGNHNVKDVKIPLWNPPLVIQEYKNFSDPFLLSLSLWIKRDTINPTKKSTLRND